MSIDLKDAVSNVEHAAESAAPGIVQAQMGLFDHLAVADVTVADEGERDDELPTATAASVHDGPVATPDVDSDLPGGGKARIGENMSVGESINPSDVATTATEPVATEVKSSKIACPVPQASVDPPHKPSKVDAPTRAPWMVSKAEHKRCLDAIQEDDTPARWFDDEIAAQAKKIARAEAKKAAKLKAH